MHRLNSIKPDIKFYYNGRIDISARASQRMQLSKDSRLSFFLDDDGNLYVKKDENGLTPSLLQGKRFFRFYSVETTRLVIRLPDVPEKVSHVGFRIGEPECGELFPIITRMPL